MPGMRALVTRTFNIGNGNASGHRHATPSQPEGVPETIGSGGFKSRSRKKQEFGLTTSETGTSSMEDLRPKE